MKVVTAGRTYLDIDAYAGCVAYAELLRLQGYEAVAASSGVPNGSVTATVRSWQAPLLTDYRPGADDRFILIDISDPDHFDSLVDLEKVEEIIDHHLSHEMYWQERLGERARIEPIGAACTQVYERWLAAGLAGEMSRLSARLLVCGILDNTLNFKAAVTTERDHQAYRALMAIAGLPAGWPERYFRECQASILADIGYAIANDTKRLQFSRLGPDKVAVGQLTLWDGAAAVRRRRADFEKVMRRLAATEKPAPLAGWFLNVISLADGRSYFLADGQAVMAWAEQVLDVTFEEGLAVAGRLWLRKEIIRADMAASAAPGQAQAAAQAGR